MFISHSRDFVGVSGIILTITRARYDASSVTCLDLQHLFCTSCMQIWHSNRLATQLNKGILAQNFQHYSWIYQKKQSDTHPKTPFVCVFFQANEFTWNTPQAARPHCGWPETGYRHWTVQEEMQKNRSNASPSESFWMGLSAFFCANKTKPQPFGLGKNKTAATKEKIQAVGGRETLKNVGFWCFVWGGAT